MKPLYTYFVFYVLSTNLVEGIFPSIIGAGLSTLKGLLFGATLTTRGFIGSSDSVYYRDGIYTNRRSLNIEYDDLYRRHYGQGRNNRRRNYYQRKRYGRSVQDDQSQDFQFREKRRISDDLILKANVQDLDDCAKKFICELSAKDETILDDFELSMKSAFGVDKRGNLDVKSISARFDFAASVGQNGGNSQCKILFRRCTHSYKVLKGLYWDLCNQGRTINSFTFLRGLQ